MLFSNNEYYESSCKHLYSKFNNVETIREFISNGTKYMDFLFIIFSYHDFIEIKMS